jgi:rhodanese-related sulfurtransferase
MSKDDFVRMMTTDLPEPPAYFQSDAEINRTGASAIKEIPRPTELTPYEVKKFAEQGHPVLDVRTPAQFGNGYVPGAINIALSGQFASWAGTLLPLKEPIVLIAEDLSSVDEAVTRLARVGIEGVKGFLAGGMYAWDKAGFPIATIAQIPVDELKQRVESHDHLTVLDVRRPAEYESGHVPGAISTPLARLRESASQFDPAAETAVICASGYRSSVATSILAKLGFQRLFNVVGGTSAWTGAGYKTKH